MISHSLNEVFQKSIIYAKELKHEYITIEHVFYQLLNSPEGAKIIFACGGDVQKMKELIKDYIYSNTSTLPQNVNDEPFESVALSRLIDRMIKHIQSSQQHSADIGDLLVAIYDEVNSFAYMLLSEYHISRLDILEIISHSDEAEAPKESESSLQKYSLNLLK
ncbi:MAG: ATP-dependent Clp protease ATP-binding subunit ClpA [Campylobacterota bacterium]|nr:ATP-dependent Clp protease ATP-binding subunit ClpA [Campylobacterota bacterium]